MPRLNARGFIAVCILLTATACLLNQAAAAGTATHPGNAKVVARVNRVPITETDVQERLENYYPSSSAHGGLRAGKFGELRAKAIQDLITDELAWQQAVRQGRVVGDQQTLREYRKWRAQYGAAAFDAELKSRGMTRAQYLQSLKRQLTIKQLGREHVLNPSKISDAELRDYYNKNQARYLRPERVHFQLFLVALPATASAEQERAAREKIEGFRRQILSGKDFGELAYNNSDDMYRAKSGDVGWMHKGSLDAEFEAPAFTLPIGQLSEAIRSSQGYNLMKVLERQAAHQLSFEEMRTQLRAELEKKRLEKLKTEWALSLRAKARIEVLENQPVAESHGAPSLFSKSH